MWLVDIIALVFLRVFVSILNAVPLKFRERLLISFIRAIFYFLPNYRKIAYRNLQLVFPHATSADHEDLFQSSIRTFGRIFLDLARIHTLGPDWVRDNVECPYLDDYKRIKEQNPDKGVLFATGHLGSFEVLAHCVPIYGYPISFIVRSFRLQRVNAWWKSKREVRGNRAIDRRGAVKATVAELLQGRDVGVLFDQNLTRNHAVFVNFFGKLAATTKLIGIAAIRTECPIVCASIQYLGNDRYRINALEVPVQDLYSNTEISSDDKIRIITERVTAEYEKMILANPGEWFWFHRRWKTTPEGVEENFYL
jgi:KDO2-lipid IV(A) lauroyltransferase